MKKCHPENQMAFSKLTINQIVKNYRTMSFVAKSLVRVDLII